MGDGDPQTRNRPYKIHRQHMRLPGRRLRGSSYLRKLEYSLVCTISRRSDTSVIVCSISSTVLSSDNSFRAAASNEAACVFWAAGGGGGSVAFAAMTARAFATRLAAAAACSCLRFCPDNDDGLPPDDMLPRRIRAAMTPPPKPNARQHSHAHSARARGVWGKSQLPTV